MTKLGGNDTLPTFAIPHAHPKSNFLSGFVRDQGTFIDTTFTTSRINNNSAHVEGTAKFSGGTQQIIADLEERDDKWRVTEIDIHP